MKRILSIIALAVMLVIPIRVDAAGLRISANSTSIVNGNSVRVTVNASGLTGKFSVTSSDSGVLSGGTGSEWFENESKTYTFSSKGLGKATITVRALDVADSNGNTWNGSQSVTISVVKPREKSNNNNLKSLSVEGYALTPEFSKDTLEYNVEVTDDKETIKINAEREDGYSSLEGDGEKEVAEGINKFEVKVTSETGKEKVYTLNINVKDANPIEKVIGKETYSLVKRSKTLVVPKGLDSEKFVLSNIILDEVEIPALVSEELNLTFVGLKDKNDIIYLYKVEDGVITTRYELLTTKGLSVEFKEPKKVPDDYTKVAIKIGDKEYTAYQNKYKDYALVYGTNIETKEDNWYQYDLKEETLQLYNSDQINDLNKDHNKEINNYKTLLYCAAGVASLLLLIIIVLIILLVRKKNNKKVDIEKIFDEPKDTQLEKTKELDKSEIIINKVEPKKNEVEPVKKETSKQAARRKAIKQIVDAKPSEFLNTQELKEILETPKLTAEPLPKLVKKRRTKVIEDEEMALDFLDEKQKKRRTKK